MIEDKKEIYFDNAATTPVSQSVLDAMLPYFTDEWGNPSGLYRSGRDAAKVLHDARKTIADALGCSDREIYFTSGGSEADNWAVKGYAHANRMRGRHIISSAYEHHAVMNSLKSLESEGFDVTYVYPDSQGFISPDDIEREIRDDTILVCCMTANNEIGTIQPVKEIVAAAHRHKCAFLTDAVQAVGAIPVDISVIGCDMMSLSGHKLHAPKGIGALYIRRDTPISRLIDGGGQERGMRAGTENVPYITGLARAVSDAVSDTGKNIRIAGLRDRLADGLLKIPRTHINGAMENRLPGNLNMAFDCCEGESLLLLLDMRGIAVSAGSACSSRAAQPSHVLKAIGLSDEIIRSSVRFSLGDINTEDEVDTVIKATSEIVEKIRALNPLWKG